MPFISPGALPVPGDDRLRFDDHQCRPPIVPDLGQPRPQQTIGGGQLRPLDATFEAGNLVPESENLNLNGFGANLAPW